MGNFIHVAGSADIPPGTGKTVDVAGTPVALFNVDGTFYAIHNTCLHRQGPLGEGDLSGNVVSCPWHGWEYDVTTGKSLTSPEACVGTFDVKVEGEKIFVRSAC